MELDIINVGNYEKTIEQLQKIKEKNYGNLNVRINNLHVKDINSLIRKNIFSKNDAYISAETLWEITQPVGENKHHHSHDLSIDCVFKTLNSINKPFCVLKSRLNRFAIISSFEENNLRLLTIVEINVPILLKRLTKINKIITIYPKDNIDNYLKGKTILYIK